ncbi:MAG: hypothetical protein KBA51_08630 [Kiritimatiellae bacterium]|nr:hypothetical protein [Kiritimatiellia bacterium]
MSPSWIGRQCGTVLTCIALLACATDAPAAHYKLFVLTGQSNSLGTTNGGEADPTSDTDPADAHIPFAWHNIAAEGVTIGHSGQTLTPATTTPDFTTLRDQQGGYYAGSATHWGGEMEFARTLYRAGVRNFGIIKASRGGGGNTYWLKGSADDHMYVHVVNTVSAATADLTSKGHTYEIVGLLYLQGESDNSTEAAEAGTRLKLLTDNLRADLPNAANLHTVAAGTTAVGNADDATSRANQKAIADATSYIDFFPNLDLTLSPDGLHLNKAGKLRLGNRWAQAFLNAGIVSRHYGKLVFIGDSITQGGNGYPSYRYPVFKNLANAGVPQDSSTGYAFTGSVTGAYQNNAGSTPDASGQAFVNQHDGHWGWRASWECARVALPANRYNVNNLGNGTLLNWTGQSTTYATANAGTLTYTGVTYVPDTASILIGINDLADGVAATQVRDDIGTLIDQLRASNPNVRIFLNKTLHTNQGATRDQQVNDLHALLPALVAAKNAASAASPVWLVDPDTGFVPSTMTYDGIHPNTAGETHVGDLISAGLGIIETPSPSGPPPPPLEEKSSDDLGWRHFEGSDIYNSGSYASGWTGIGDLANPTPTGTSDLILNHPNGTADTLEGTNSGWTSLNSRVWTFETRLKFTANPNGFILWLATGTKRILVEIYGNRTQDYGGESFNVAHDNLDGNYHTFTVRHDPAAGRYYVWRDGALLNPGGSVYDQTVADTKLLMGDYTSGTFGNGFNVTVDYVRYRGGYEGNEIYSGSAYINGWGVTGGISPSLVDSTDLRIINTTAGGSWVEGTSAGWTSIKDGYWTLETRLKFNANPNGFMLWLGTAAGRAMIEMYGDRTQDNGNQVFNVAHNNADGAFHTFRVGHDPSKSVYHVWRDGVRLTPPAGAAYDSTADTRLILGDYTSGTFGNNFDVVIDYVRMDSGNSYLPPGADADGDGMSDLFENEHFGDIVSAPPDGDLDVDGMTNLDEYIADTHPGDPDSLLTLDSIRPESSDPGDGFLVSISYSSAQRVYFLLRTTDLMIPMVDWDTVSGPMPGADGELTLRDGFPPETAAFYGVEVALP